MKIIFIGIALFELISLSVAQRVAPGVPPQQYVSKLYSVWLAIR